jgi:hypothetical protein
MRRINSSHHDRLISAGEVLSDAAAAPMDALVQRTERNYCNAKAAPLRTIADRHPK